MRSSQAGWQRHDAHFRKLGESLEEREERAVAGILSRLQSADGTSPRALDLGCGDGSLANRLSLQGFDVLGVDVSRSHIRKARREFRPRANSGLLRYRRADAGKALARCRAESTSLITAFHIIEHLDPRALPRTCEQAFRILEPGGLFVVEIPNLDNLRVGASTVWIDQTHRRPLHYLTVEFFLREAGFSVEVCQVHPLDPQWASTESEALREIRRRIDGPGDTRLYARRPNA